MFLSSFLAILIAGLIIAFYNRSYLKHERWCKTADEFCTNLEKVIIDYFDSHDDEAQRIISYKKFYAYLDAFIPFVEKKNKPEIGALLKELLNLDFGENTEEEKIKGADT